MGRVHLEHIGGVKLYSCAQCDTNLTNKSQLISTRFTGSTGNIFFSIIIMKVMEFLYLKLIDLIRFEIF